MTEPTTEETRVPLVLAVDDEPGILRLLQLTLSSAGFRVVTAPDGASALRIAGEQHPDLVVVDLIMAPMPGLELLARLKEAVPARPVIAVSVRSNEAAKVEALQQGADDFVSKPFVPEDLVARIQYLLNTGGAGEGALVRVGNVEINILTASVERDGKPIVLSKTEWQLLALLRARNGEPALFSDLLVKVWGPHYRDEVQFLKVWMARLRHKLEGDPPSRELIRDFHGVGYGLDIGDEEDSA